jgi:hypothetical protein
MKDKQERTIPSLRTVRKAAESLPPIETWRADTIQVPVSDGRLVEFRKIKLKAKGRTGERWIYDGKVIVT